MPKPPSGIWSVRESGEVAQTTETEILLNEASVGIKMDGVFNHHTITYQNTDVALKATLYGLAGNKTDGTAIWAQISGTDDIEHGNSFVVDPVQDGRYAAFKLTFADTGTATAWVRSAVRGL